jgi:tRNA(His) guanylyltransferase
MKFSELDKIMRIFETTNDLPGIYIIARLDGRCFTRLTKEINNFEAPFFRDYMIEPTKHLIDCGLKII